MPSIKDDSTVQLIAETFCGDGKRNKELTLKLVGYKPSYYKAGRSTAVVYGNERVKAAIMAIDTERKEKSVATRKQRQEFWTRVMTGTVSVPMNMGDRLRASELLGKSEADFVEVHKDISEKQRQLDENEAKLAEELSQAYMALKYRQGARAKGA